MDSQIIERILLSTKTGRKSFRGCFPSDRLPNPLKYPFGIIINEDPSFKQGSHWVAVFAKDAETVYYFDSFARKPIESIEKYLSNFAHVSKNSQSFQSLIGQTCGQYCIFFIYYSSLGISYHNTLKILSNQENPDVYVQYFVKRLSQYGSI
jgi:hypothetical protein